MLLDHSLISDVIVMSYLYQTLIKFWLVGDASLANMDIANIGKF